MRNISDVLITMLRLIPDTEAEWAIRHDLEGILDSTYYAAPEAIGMWWEVAGTALAARFPVEPTEGWQKQVIDTFMDRCS